MVTIKMIARECGLSTAAVSRALNHLPGVSPENAERVRRIAKEMGYIPNTAARALKTNRSNIIGILYRNKLAHEFFSVVLEGILDEAERCGYELTFLSSNPGVSYADHARQRQCAGVIVVQGLLFDHDNVMTLVNSNIPTVSVEYEYPDGTMIVNDNIGAMEEIVRYLHDDMGHSRIAYIHGEICQVTNERLTGFYRGCRDCGITVPQEYVRQGLFRNPDASAEQTRQLLALPKPPTCILYPDDVSYLGGVCALEEMGRSIPGDLSTAGYDGTIVGQAFHPRLTTVRQDAESMGASAANELARIVEAGGRADIRRILVPGALIPGETVRPIAQ